MTDEAVVLGKDASPRLPCRKVGRSNGDVFDESAIAETEFLEEYSWEPES
jgi:hypothetical protein